MDGRYGGSAIKPFWEMIPHFFLYGLKPRSLIVAALLAMLNYAFGGGLINLVLIAITIKYSMVALQESAEGNLEPPEFSYDTLAGRYELPIKLYIVIFFYSAMMGGAANIFGAAAFILMAVAGVALFPAMVITLAHTESFLQAINPVNSLAMAKRIGGPYLVMLLFLFLFGSIEKFAQYFFVNNAPEAAIEPLLIAINTVFSLITFHMMGYILLQYHEQLGLETPAGVTSQAAEEQRYTPPLLQSFMESGNVAAAVAEMEHMIRRTPNDLELWRRLHIYLITQGQQEKLASFAPAYITALLDNNRYSEAAKLYLDGCERGHNYRPAQIKHFRPLMRALREKRAGKQAVALANGAHNLFPDHTLIPELYLDMATILCEELQRDDLAMKTLQYLQNNFSDHTSMPEVQSYLGVVQRLQQSS